MTDKNVIVIATKAELSGTPVIPGQTLYIEDEQKVYTYSEDGVLTPMEIASNVQMTAYDINKQIMIQLPRLTPEEIEGTKSLFAEYNQNEGQEYFMLLCHELRYYTLFRTGCYTDERAEDIIVDECLKNLGDIISIEKSANGCAIEIWIAVNDEAYVMYYFNYDEGVVECQ